MDMRDTLTGSLKVVTFTDDIAPKTQLNTNNISGSGGNSFSIIMSGLAANWDYMPNEIYFSWKSEKNSNHETKFF